MKIKFKLEHTMYSIFNSTLSNISKLLGKDILVNENTYCGINDAKLCDFVTIMQNTMFPIFTAIKRNINKKYRLKRIRRKLYKKKI